MSYSFSFFASDVHSARRKLHDADAPGAVKALVECVLNGIQAPTEHYYGVGVSVQAGTNDEAKVASLKQEAIKETANRAAPRRPTFKGVLVESYGHIDENGQRSHISVFRVEPFYE